MSAPVVSLDAADAHELGEILEFLTGWLHTDPEVLAASFARYSLGLFDLNELTTELSRFAFLVGGDGRLVVGE